MFNMCHNKNRKGERNMLAYKFFDYKYNIPNFTSDLYSTAHLVYIALAVVSVIVFAIIFRNAKHKNIDIFLKVLSIVMVVLEITKICWESYWDISTGHGFNYGGILPLYTCSLFIYCLLFGAWGKKGSAAREYSLSFIATISLVSGAIGIVQCNGLNWYPFWTFGAFYSLIFHYLMFATGVLVLATKFKKLEWADIVKGWVPMAILAIAAIPASYEYGADYMQIREGSGIPLFSNLAEVLASANLRWIFSIIMLVSYMILSTVVVSSCKLIEHISAKRQSKQQVKKQ